MCSVHLILAALFCGMYSVHQIVIAVYCGMRSIHEWALEFWCDYCPLSYCDTLHSVACISFLWQLFLWHVFSSWIGLCFFLCGLHTAFTFLMWQLFIMWHMFSSSVCDNSLCDMFSYCDSSSNGMCSADLIATNHRPEKLSTSCWSVVRGQQRVGQVQLRQWLWQISEILTSNICYTKLQDCSCNLRTAHCNHHTIFGEVHGSQMPYNKSYIHKERDTHMYTNLRRIKTNVINAYTYANDKLNCSWINFIATKHGKFSRKPQAGSVRKTLAGICRSLLFDVLSTLFRRIFILWM